MTKEQREFDEFNAQEALRNFSEGQKPVDVNTFSQMTSLKQYSEELIKKPSPPAPRHIDEYGFAIIRKGRLHPYRIKKVYIANANGYHFIVEKKRYFFWRYVDLHFSEDAARMQIKELKEKETKTKTNKPIYVYD